MAHKGEAEDKGIDLVLDDRTKPGIDCYAQMEPSDASLVFDNLIENAIMYTDEGSILVSFEPHGNEIVTTVADTGIGIPLPTRRASSSASTASTRLAAAKWAARDLGFPSCATPSSARTARSA